MRDHIIYRTLTFHHISREKNFYNSTNALISISKFCARKYTLCNLKKYKELSGSGFHWCKAETGAHNFMQKHKIQVGVGRFSTRMILDPDCVIKFPKMFSTYPFKSNIFLLSRFCAEPCASGYLRSTPFDPSDLEFEWKHVFSIMLKLVALSNLTYA
jgi:hypothetical protein